MVEELKYTGRPLSALMQIATAPDEIPLWSWFPTAYGLAQNAPESIEQLIASGYERISFTPGSSENVEAINLIGQLCDLLRTPPSENSSEKGYQFWARKADIEHVKRYPVMLLFPINLQTQEDSWQRIYMTDDHQLNVETLHDSRETNIPMLQFLPPPEVGEYALVTTGKGLALYQIHQLPDKAQALWHKIGTALRDLASPGGWYDHNNLGSLCADEDIYQNISTGEMDSSFRKRLTETHQHITALRQSWQKQDWVSQWKEISQMVQELAVTYYEHHKNETANAKKTLPRIANVFVQGMADIYTALPFQAFSAATISTKAQEKDGQWLGGDWMQEAGQKENDLILSYRYKKDSGSTYVQIHEDATDKKREEVLANMWKQSTMYSDLDSDVYLACLAQLIRGEKDAQGNTWITGQQILKYRGIKPKKNSGDPDGHYTGGYRWEDLEAIAACINRQKNITIKIAEMNIIDDTTPPKKQRRGRTSISRESPLFMRGDTIYHKTLPLEGESYSIAIAWQYRESSWMLPFLSGPNRFTGQLIEKVLNYDPVHEQWEKRLSKYFMWWIRANASKPKNPDLYIGTLLNELNLPIDERNPQRTRDRFEKAMNQLAKDNLITWHYQEEMQLPGRKWLPTWLQQQIIVEDPPELKEIYKTIESTARVIRTNQYIQKQAQKNKSQGGRTQKKKEEK